MVMKDIALVQTDNKDVNQAQQNIKQSISPLISNPANSGHMVKGQKLVAGANTINHGLGHTITGYYIASTSAPISYSDNIQGGGNLSQSFVLTVNVAATANIYCF